LGFETMKAIEITTFGDPSVLKATTRPDPTPQAGEVLVRVAASGVNRPDVLQRRGLYPMPAGVSDVPGLEVAGTIVGGDPRALEEGPWAIGDRVCALVAGGGYAELCTAPAAQCLPIPVGLTDIEAASLPETLFTVWQNLFHIAGLKSGEWVLVHGGSSGIGVAAIQMAKAHGARVIVTVGNGVKAKACLALGADHAIDYNAEDFVGAVLRLTDQRGVDVVLDMVAGDYIERDLRCMADDARLALIAVQGGTQSKIDAGLMLRKRLSMVGSTLRPRSLAYKAQLARELREHVWPWIEARRVRPIVHATLPAEQAAQAHALMESSQHVGKIVLTW
jgi:NADPH:quinone reductase